MILTDPTILGVCRPLTSFSALCHAGMSECGDNRAFCPLLRFFLFPLLYLGSGMSALERFCGAGPCLHWVFELLLGWGQIVEVHINYELVTAAFFVY